MTVTTQRRPWGASRVTPFDPSAGVEVPRVQLDPETQTGRYYDPEGQPIKAGKHGTNVETNKATTTSTRDGKEPQNPDSDSTTAYDQD
ncbi:putative ATP-grasp-modified RiPP [Sphaerisporangium sp. NPDC051017]|uniref:putative ATP-grasp-modified RiPP n=1 Tax=Sphaerisporangium sp. NPDC051017 TaxID=3154636 RepID=UPI00341C3A7E